MKQEVSNTGRKQLVSPSGSFGQIIIALLWPTVLRFKVSRVVFVCSAGLKLQDPCLVKAL